MHVVGCICNCIVELDLPARECGQSLTTTGQRTSSTDWLAFILGTQYCQQFGGKAPMTEMFGLDSDMHGWMRGVTQAC